MMVLLIGVVLLEVIKGSAHAGDTEEEEKEISKLAKKKYGLRLVADEAHMVANVLKWGMENTEVVDYQDLLWLPSEFGYFTNDSN